MNHAITFGTVTALLICCLIVVAFVGYLIHVPVAIILAVLFILAMLAFIASLITFLREVMLVAASTHIEAR